MCFSFLRSSLDSNRSKKVCTDASHDKYVYLCKTCYKEHFFCNKCYRTDEGTHIIKCCGKKHNMLLDKIKKESELNLSNHRIAKDTYIKCVDCGLDVQKIYTIKKRCKICNRRSVLMNF